MDVQYRDFGTFVAVTACDREAVREFSVVVALVDDRYDVNTGWRFPVAADEFLALGVRGLNA